MILQTWGCSSQRLGLRHLGDAPYFVNFLSTKVRQPHYLVKLGHVKLLCKVELGLDRLIAIITCHHWPPYMWCMWVTMVAVILNLRGFG